MEKSEEKARDVGEAGGTDGQPKAGFERPYTDEDVYRAVARYNGMIMHGDYFFSYATMGTPAFEDFLIDHFGRVDGPYKDGYGTVISVYDNSGNVQERISRVFLAEAGPAGWWRIAYEDSSERHTYEVRVDRFSVPREVRFILPQNGKVYYRKTRMGQSMEDTPGSMSDDDISAQLEQERRRSLEESVGMLGMDIEKKEEVLIELAGREVLAAHYNGTAGNGAVAIDIWYSPDITGNLLRMMTDGRVAMEITSFIEDAEREYTDELSNPFPQDLSMGGVRYENAF